MPAWPLCVCHCISRSAALSVTQQAEGSGRACCGRTHRHQGAGVPQEMPYLLACTSFSHPWSNHLKGCGQVVGLTNYQLSRVYTSSYWGRHLVTGLNMMEQIVLPGSNLRQCSHSNLQYRPQHCSLCTPSMHSTQQNRLSF